MSCKFDYDTLSTTATATTASETVLPDNPARPEPTWAPQPVVADPIVTDETQRTPVLPVGSPIGWQAGPALKPTSETTTAAGIWGRRSTKTKAAIVGIAAVLVLGSIGNALGSPDEGTGAKPSQIAAVGSLPSPTRAPAATTKAETTSTPAPDPTPTLEPTPAPTAEPTPVPTPKPTATPKPEYKKLNSRNWAKVVKNPDAYLGRTYQIWGCIFQFDGATGPDSFLAQTSYKKLEYWYSDGENAAFLGEISQLADIVEDDVVVMNVTSMGSYSYDTQAGGNTTVPLFSIDKITRKGSCE
jgi:hypothetical protein